VREPKYSLEEFKNMTFGKGIDMFNSFLGVMCLIMIVLLVFLCVLGVWI